MIEDLAVLTHLNEASVLHTLKQRHDHWMICVCAYALLLREHAGTHTGNVSALSQMVAFLESKQTHVGIVLEECPPRRDLALTFPPILFIFFFVFVLFLFI